MQPILNEVLARRRDRAIAVILGFKDRECDKYLPAEVSGKLRKVVLDQYNEFYDFVMDLVRSLDNGEYVLNETYFERIEARLEDIHRHMTTTSNGQKSS